MQESVTSRGRRHSPGRLTTCMLRWGARRAWFASGTFTGFFSRHPRPAHVGCCQGDASSPPASVPAGSQQRASPAVTLPIRFRSCLVYLLPSGSKLLGDMAPLLAYILSGVCPWNAECDSHAPDHRCCCRPGHRVTRKSGEPGENGDDKSRRKVQNVVTDSSPGIKRQRIC